MQLSAEQKVFILGYLLEGKSLKFVAKELMVSYHSLWNAVQNDASFRAKVSTAREEGVHARVDRLDEVGEDKTIDPHRARLISDNIKWIAARLSPKVYGDRIDVNMVQTIDIGANLKEARARSAIDVQPMSNPRLPVDAVDAVFTALPDLRTTDRVSGVARRHGDHAAATEDQSSGSEPDIFD